jgi:hypothetical protein
MTDDSPSPQINVSKIPGGGGVAGAMFAISSMLIFLIGIPALRYFLPPAVVLACGVAISIHLFRIIFPKETPGTPWILSATKR